MISQIKDPKDNHHHGTLITVTKKNQPNIHKF